MGPLARGRSGKGRGEFGRHPQRRSRFDVRDSGPGAERPNRRSLGAERGNHSRGATAVLTIPSTGITEYLRGGGDRDTAARIAGHESTRTTRLLRSPRRRGDARRDRADPALGPLGQGLSVQSGHTIGGSQTGENRDERVTSATRTVAFGQRFLPQPKPPYHPVGLRRDGKVRQADSPDYSRRLDVEVQTRSHGGTFVGSLVIGSQSGCFPAGRSAFSVFLAGMAGFGASAAADWRIRAASWRSGRVGSGRNRADRAGDAAPVVGERGADRQVDDDSPNRRLDPGAELQQALPKQLPKGMGDLRPVAVVRQAPRQRLAQPKPLVAGLEQNRTPVRTGGSWSN